MFVPVISWQVFCVGGSASILTATGFDRRISGSGSETQSTVQYRVKLQVYKSQRDLTATVKFGYFSG